MWHLIRKAARHWGNHYESEAGKFRARRLQLSMNLAEHRFARWAEDGGVICPRLEVLGDLCEMALARGYCNKDAEVIIPALSRVACLILEIYGMLMNQCPRGHMEPRGYMEPSHYADALLMAACGHRSSNFTKFLELTAHVQFFSSGKFDAQERHFVP